MVRQSQRRFWATLALLGAAAFAVRAAACDGELWLDEIFGWEDATAATSLWDLFGRIYRRNSHCVNVVWTYLVGDTPHWWLYRLPSLAAGLLLLPLAAWPLRRQAGERAALAALALFGASFFMTTYASEARAYAGVMLHALLAFRLVESGESRPSPVLDWALALNLLLGALWQPAFLLVWGALTAWAPFSGRKAASLARMLAPPWAVLGGLAACGILVQTVAVGPERGRLAVFGGFLKAAFVPAGPNPLAVLLGVGVAAAFAASFLRPPAFETRRLRLLRLSLCTVPVLGILAAPSASIFERYFSAALPFLYLSALYGLLPFMSPRPDRAHWAARALAAGVLASNVAATAAFLKDGRGHVLDALRAMAAGTPSGAPVRWVTDHPYRNGTLARFYARYVPEARFEVVSHKDMGDAPARWAVIHQIEDDEYPFAPPVLPIDLHRYRFVKTFAKTGLSGFRWHLYALEDNLSPAPRRP